MAQIIPENTSIGASLGAGLGSGLGNLLQGFAQHKLQSALQRNQALALEQALRQLSGEEPQQGFLPEGFPSLEMLAQEEQPQQQMPQLQQLGKFSSMQDIAKSLLQQQQPQAAQAQQQLKPTPTLKQARAAEPLSTQAALLRAGVSPEQRLKIAALQQQRQQHLEKLSATEQREVDKETKPYYDELAKLSKGAKESEIRLDRMRELIDRGNLRGGFTSAITNLLDKIGFDVSSLEGADTQEFRKLSNDFIKNAKDFFGSRITDQDLKAFLKTIPNVTQSNEAKIRVINNLKSFNQIALLKKKAADEIIKRNGGRRPRNLDTLVDEETSAQVDAIARKFRDNLNFDDTASKRPQTQTSVIR